MSKAGRARRAELGVSKQAERSNREFELLVRRRRAELATRQAAPVVSLAPKRRALAWFGLALVAFFVGLAVLGAIAS